LLPGDCHSPLDAIDLARLAVIGQQFFRKRPTEAGMLQRIEEAAALSVARACGFAGIAIATFVVGLSGDMVLAFRAGGMLALLTALVLLLKARWAPRQHYKTTEVWLLLPPPERPQEVIAQQIIGTVMRETYLRFALHAALFALAMLTAAIVYGGWFAQRVAT
jgi:hypothetical protein